LIHHETVIFLFSFGSLFYSVIDELTKYKKGEWMNALTRRQREIFDFLRDNHETFPHPPTLDELCAALGRASRGSLHKHISALIDAGLVESFAGNKQGGIRLTAQAQRDFVACEHALPLVGRIAAGQPMEALENINYVAVPEMLKSDKPCYVLQIKGDSMVEAGIVDGDWVVIEQRSYASNGEIVVALIDGSEATLKYLEQSHDKVMLLPANASMEAMAYRPDQVKIQGVLVGQMRSYRSR
jgi:repressor LexA